MNHKLKEILGLGVIIIAWILVIYILYLQLYPFEPLEIKDITLLNNQVKQGDMLLVNVNVCKNSNTQAIVSKNLQDGIVYALPSIITNAPIDCQNYISSTLIPKALPIGLYRLETVYTYHIGFRNIRISYITDEFEVIE